MTDPNQTCGETCGDNCQAWRPDLLAPSVGLCSCENSPNFECLLRREDPVCKNFVSLDATTI